MEQIKRNFEWILAWNLGVASKAECIFNTFSYLNAMQLLCKNTFFRIIQAGWEQVRKKKNVMDIFF
jgi:hypothetical protein